MKVVSSVSRSLVVFALMLAVTAASVLAIPTNRLSDTRITFDLNSAIPKEFGEWRIDTSVIPIPPSPDQQSVLDKLYDQIVSRTYVNSHGERIMLSITYGSRQNQQLRAHRQEVCYAAQGFKITNLERTSVDVAGGPIPVTRLVATQQRRVEPLTYWFTTGDAVVMSYWDREFAQFRYALSGYIPDGYLVRVSKLSDDPKSAFDQHVEFANELLSHVDPELRRRLVGHS